jgi:putative transposase
VCQALPVPRLARIVVPGIPHHVTQRGNGRQRVFYADGDGKLYLDLLRKACAKAGVSCWAYVLMPNHVHMILVPREADSLRAALARAHRSYAGILNARLGQPGHFWQGRFGAVAMDEEHLAAAFCYVLRNPVRAGLCARPQDWKWSSAGAYLKERGDGFTETGPMLSRFPDMGNFLATEPAPDLMEALRKAETIGRPVGAKAFIAQAEAAIGRSVGTGQRGRPRNSALSPIKL